MAFSERHKIKNIEVPWFTITKTLHQLQLQQIFLNVHIHISPIGPKKFI